MEASVSKMMSGETVTNLLKTLGIGFRPSSDSLFEATSALEVPKFKRLGVIGKPPGGKPNKSSSQKIICDIITCKQEFDSVTAFNSHYNTNHRHTCDECKKVLPTPHLLDLHLSETHDSFFAVAALKKPMYSCYLETCNHKSQNDKERKDHCIKSHNFPPNFRFSGNKRKPKKNKKASENENSMEIDESSRTSGELFTRPVITKFAFGKTSKLFIPKGKKSTKSNILENDSTMVTDLMESLPS